MTEQKINYSDLRELLWEVYEKRIPFNRILGIKIEHLDADNVCVKIDMKKELIGNYVKGILHGGVISSIIDVTGGLATSAAILEKMEGYSIEEIITRFTKLSTVDLRIDYLRTGTGKHFLSKGSVLRTGNKITVIKTEFRNDQGLLIAAGTGTYLI